LKKLTKIAQEFLDKKNEIHQIEDPEFLDDLSDIFDLRNWNLKSFDPANDDCAEIFEKEKTEMIEKFTENKKVFEDIENCQDELSNILTCIFENEKERNDVLFEASKYNHIIDQWKFLYKVILEIIESETKNFLRIIKRAAISPNGQTGCERVNIILLKLNLRLI